MCGDAGDHAVKAVGVIPEPEVKVFDLEESDQFMIIASDGVWEFITSQVLYASAAAGCGVVCFMNISAVWLSTRLCSVLGFL